jgi:hypothetical protein
MRRSNEEVEAAMGAANGRQRVIAIVAITAVLATAAIVSAAASPTRRVILYGRI